MSSDRPAAEDQVWQRLSPRMLLVHPVHEVLRQIPLLIGWVVLGSATGNPMWTLFGLALIVGYGVARWFTTTYRIDTEQVQLRAGVLQRKVLSVPRNRIRSVSTDARLLHRLLGLTVLRVGTGQEAKGTGSSRRRRPVRGGRSSARGAARGFACSCRRRGARPAGSWPAGRRPGCATARLSFTGLAMILAAVGLVYQAGVGAALQHSGLTRSGLSVAERFGSSPAWRWSRSWWWCASVVLSVLRSL